MRGLEAGFLAGRCPLLVAEILRESPVGVVIAGERDIGNPGAYHLDGDAVALEDAVVELAVFHFAGVDQFAGQV